MAYLDEIGIFQYLLLLWITLICFVAFTFGKKRKPNLPPGPRGLPIVGYLPFLGKNPHLELSKLGQKYGHLFSIYFGSTHTVVVTDAKLAKELLSKRETADRPPGLFQMMPDGIGLAETNGQEWKEQRRYCMMQLRNLGLGKSNWEKLVQLEVSDVIQAISQSEGEPYDVYDVLSASLANNIVTLLTDHRLGVGDPKRNIIDQGVNSFQSIYNQSGLIVHYPKLFKFLVDLKVLSVGDKLKSMMKMNEFIRQEINELKEKKESESFIKKYLNEIEINESMNLGNSFDEKNLIGNVQAFVIAGSDTAYCSISWILLAMASFPEIQEKIHEELENVLGKDGSADWVDRHKLPYCLATIMEGQRWRTITSLNLLHNTNEDIVVNGYDIPKGTRIMTVLWAFHHDPKHWRDPNVFQPKRFLSNDGKNVVEQEAYLPFSFGIRLCPGKTVAYIEIFHYFVSIMQKFQVLPESETISPDLEGNPGIALLPKRQSLRFVPR